MLARVERAAVFAVEGMKFLQMAYSDLMPLLCRGSGEVAAIFQEALNLAEYPGAALRSAADHQCVRARVTEDMLRALRRIDIAIGNNGDSHCLFDCGDGVVFHCALEAALTGSPMDGEKLNTAVLGYFGDFDTIAGLGTPAGADFKRDGNIDRGDH